MEVKRKIYKFLDYNDTLKAHIEKVLVRVLRPCGYDKHHVIAALYLSNPIIEIGYDYTLLVSGEKRFVACVEKCYKMCKPTNEFNAVAENLTFSLN